MANECVYGCGAKDIKDLEEHYAIDHAWNQGLRDPVSNKGADLTKLEDRPDLKEAEKAAEEARLESAKKQVHPLAQKDEKKIQEVIVQPTATAKQEVKPTATKTENK